MYDLKVIPRRKIWFTLSGTLVVLSIIALAVWGLKLGIDFTGGSLMEIQYPADQRPEVSRVITALADLNLKSLTIQPTENNGLIMRFQETTEATHQAILAELKTLSPAIAESAFATTTDTATPLDVAVTGGNGQIALQDITVEGQNKATAPTVTALEELRFEAVGPSIGAELRRNAIYSMILVLLAIIVFVAWSFRKVSRPVASWKYGLAAVLAVFHDVLITVGVFCVLGKFMGVEINTAFVAALLMILGYSVNDTIVVFDRVRENLPKSDLDFKGTVNYSLNQTMVRSFNTSFTTMLVLTAIVIFGGVSIRYFAMALLIGIFVGTYSSIFLASPLLVWFEKLKKA
ncbi:MAG: protein translocase subunit SecF [bacterium]